MNTKKGQVSLFIILGVIILIILGATFYVGRESTKIPGTEIKQNEEVSIDMSSLKSFVTSCARQSAQDAVVNTGLRGGISAPETSASFIGVAVPYYFEKGADKSPSDEKIKETLQYYMNTGMKSCTNGFDAFKQQGYDVKEGDVSSTATVADEQVIFEVNYPITMSKGSSTQTESAFSASVNVELPKMVDITRRYMKFQKTDAGYLMLGDLMDIVNEKKINFEIFEKQENGVIVSLVDNSTMIKGNPFIFVFSMKY